MTATHVEYTPKATTFDGDWFYERVLRPQTSITGVPVRRLTILAGGISGAPCDFYNATRAHNDETARRPVVLRPNDSGDPVAQLTAVQTRFGLSKVDLAKACGVQRQTVYDWYKDKFVPMSENARRLSALFDLAKEAKTRGILALNPRLAIRPLTSGRRLPELLAAETLDREEIHRALAELSGIESTRQLRSARTVRESLDWDEPSSEGQEANLRNNLRERG